MAAQMWDRYDIEFFCQHRGQYLTTRTGIERKHLAARRELVRQKVEAHTSTADRRQSPAGLAIPTHSRRTSTRAP